MEIGFTAIGAIFIIILGIVSGVMLQKAQKGMTKGDLKSLLFWLNISVVFCGIPYALWNFILESKLIIVEGSLAIIPGFFFVTLFFLCILKTSFVARKLGKIYSFGDEVKTIEKELAKTPIKKNKK